MHGNHQGLHVGNLWLQAPNRWQAKYIVAFNMYVMYINSTPKTKMFQKVKREKLNTKANLRLRHLGFNQKKQLCLPSKEPNLPNNKDKQIPTSRKWHGLISVNQRAPFHRWKLQRFPAPGGAGKDHKSPFN